MPPAETSRVYRSPTGIEYTALGVQEILGVPPITVARWYHTGKLKFYKPWADRKFIRKKDFRTFMRRNAKIGLTKYVNATLARRGM